METNTKPTTGRTKRPNKTTKTIEKLTQNYHQLTEQHKQQQQNEKKVMIDLIIEFGNLVQIINPITSNLYTITELQELSYNELYDILTNINNQSKKLI